MSAQLDSGLSLKDDIASILTDPAFHDVIIVCSDGVEVSACRAILASRSPFFKAMFHRNMQEATSKKVTLHDIKSTAMHAVLRFIHTEDIDSIDISMGFDLYRAANFLLLPKLMKLVLERAHNMNDFKVAASLLNEAVISLPWNENIKDLYEVLLMPFCTHLLTIGDLNELSENALELLLVKSTEITKFNTPEYDLLLCIIEWAWKRNATTQPADERRAIFDAINLMPKKPSAWILLRNGPSHSLLLKMMQHVNLTLICPHRLKSLMEAVDVLTETSSQYLTFCRHACRNFKCSADHPSEHRGMQITRLQWDRSKLGKNLVLLEENTVVAFLGDTTTVKGDKMASVRAATPCVAGLDGLYEWDIVVEYINKNNEVVLGLVSESYDDLDNFLVEQWALESSSGGEAYVFSHGEGTKLGHKIQKGDIITFHLQLHDGTCALSINGHYYGIAWADLPRNANLYLAATLAPDTRYRIQPHVEW